MFEPISKFDILRNEIRAFLRDSYKNIDQIIITKDFVKTWKDAAGNSIEVFPIKKEEVEIFLNLKENEEKLEYRIRCEFIYGIQSGTYYLYYCNSKAMEIYYYDKARLPDLEPEEGYIDFVLTLNGGINKESSSIDREENYIDRLINKFKWR